MPAGGVDLRYAEVGGWHDEKRTWPSKLLLEGFSYKTIDVGNAGNVTVRDRLGARPLRLWRRRRRPERGWLGRHELGYLPQPYEQLASVYRREGNESAARTVAIAKQRARRADGRHWWARWPNQAWSWCLRWTIGYGYRPWLVLIWLLAFFTAGYFVFDTAYSEHLKPATSGAGQVEFNPARYTADLLLPVALLKQREAFVADGYAAWCTFGLEILGWLLVAVVVAGLTGVFKRD